MKKRRLKKGVLAGLYVVGFVALVGMLYGLERSLFPVSYKRDEDFDYVSKTLFDNVLPVVNDVKTIGKPFLDENIKIVKSFYNYLGSSEEQQKSLIYNDSTYLQSSGVSYATENPFDVVSVLDGTVIDVKEDPLLGNIVEIRHNNDIISIYQSMDEITVKTNDFVTQGQILGKSGNANIESSLGNHLHFELIVKGQVVNPEDYYGKNLADL